MHHFPAVKQIQSNSFFRPFSSFRHILYTWTQSQAQTASDTGLQMTKAVFNQYLIMAILQHGLNVLANKPWGIFGERMSAFLRLFNFYLFYFFKFGELWVLSHIVLSLKDWTIRLTFSGTRLLPLVTRALLHKGHEIEQQSVILHHSNICLFPQANKSHKQTHKTHNGEARVVSMKFSMEKYIALKYIMSSRREFCLHHQECSA